MLYFLLVCKKDCTVLEFPGSEANIYFEEHLRTATSASWFCPLWSCFLQCVYFFRHRSGVFILNFEQVSHIIFVLPLLTLDKKMPAGLLFIWFCWFHSSFKFKVFIAAVCNNWFFCKCLTMLFVNFQIAPSFLRIALRFFKVRMYLTNILVLYVCRLIYFCFLIRLHVTY